MKKIYYAPMAKVLGAKFENFLAFSEGPTPGGQGDPTGPNAVAPSAASGFILDSEKYELKNPDLWN
jgi:hypothetical protein